MNDNPGDVMDDTIGERCYWNYTFRIMKKNNIFIKDYNLIFSTLPTNSFNFSLPCIPRRPGVFGEEILITK